MGWLLKCALLLIGGARPPRDLEGLLLGRGGVGRAEVASREDVEGHTGRAAPCGGGRPVSSIGPVCGSREPLPCAGNLVDLALHLVPRVTIAGLDLADELVPLAGDLVELVVGQLAPFLPNLAPELLPVALDLV